MKCSILLLCVFLALCEAGINIQATTYDTIPATSLGDISMSPFIRIGDSYYIIEANEKLSWYAAQHFCRRKGADLATIETAEEMQALSEYLIAQKYQNKPWFWLSGTDLAAENHFSWLGNGHPMTYTHWSAGQPDNAGGHENCVHLWQIGNEFMMNDWMCNQAAYYICEVNSPKMITFTVW